LEVAKADVIKVSRHPRFWLVGVENYRLPGSTQPDSGADLADFGGLLVHPHVGSGRPQGQRRREPPTPPPTITTRTDRFWINPIPGCA
jgi:hypothetical protein